MSKLVEQFVAAKSGNLDDGADLIFHSPHFAAVVDGVTCKTDPFSRAGRRAAEIVGDAIAALPPAATMEAAEAQLTQAIADEPRKANRTFAACAAIYSTHHREVWLFGDCQALLGSRFISNPMAVDRLMSGLRAMIIEHALAGGASEADIRRTDAGRAGILEFLKLQEAFANRATSAWGYAVLNGTPIPAELLRRFPLSPSERTVILATDGYPALASTLAETEALLARLLQADPLCIRELQGTKGVHPEAQSYDDRAYLRLEV